MKTISAALKTHIQQEVTTLCTCMTIKRRDGATFCFTDHDEAVTVDTQRFVPFNSFSRTSVMHTAELEVDQLEIHGILNSDALPRADIASGLFDFAECELFLVNWLDTTMGKLRARRGWLGEVVMNEDNTFTAELRGLTQVLTYRLGVPYAPECSADLGDRFCRIGLDPPVWQALNPYRQGDIVLGVINSATGFVNAPLVNGSFETEVAGTTLRQPTGWTTYGPSDGRWNFRSSLVDFTFGGTLLNAADGSIFATISHLVGTNDVTELGMYQDIDLIAAGLTALDIDTGLCRCVFSYNAAVLHKNGRVRGRLLTVDTNLNTTTIYDSGLQNYGLNRWFAVAANGVLIPAGTRTVRVDMYCNKNGIVSYGGTIDNIRLAFNTPSGTLGNTDQYGGVMFQAQNTGTSGSSTPAFSNLVGSLTTDAGIKWKCVTSFKEVDVVSAVTSNKIFTPTSLPGAAGFYDGGLLIWETGKNAGKSLDVKTWDGTKVETFLPTFYPILVGDRYVIHPGCDKRLTTCVDKFDNVVNFRGQPHVPGQDMYVQSPYEPAQP